MVGGHFFDFRDLGRTESSKRNRARLRHKRKGEEEFLQVQNSILMQEDKISFNLPSKKLALWEGRGGSGDSGGSI